MRTFPDLNEQGAYEIGRWDTAQAIFERLRELGEHEDDVVMIAASDLEALESEFTGGR